MLHRHLHLYDRLVLSERHGRGVSETNRYQQNRRPKQKRCEEGVEEASKGELEGEKRGEGGGAQKLSSLPPAKAD